MVLCWHSYHLHIVALQMPYISSVSTATLLQCNVQAFQRRLLTCASSTPHISNRDERKISLAFAHSWEHLFYHHRMLANCS
jgi:hypothetical protein